MQDRSIRFRFAASLAANLVRAGISFVTGLAIARGMGPAGFGEFTFLLGSFTSIRQLLDMGSSNAFFTFLSQRPRSRSFVYAYLVWQGLQLFLPLLAIGLLLPRTWVDLIWIARERDLVVLALLASFMQQQAWQTVSQIGDSFRQTHRVQLVGLAVVVLHCVLVVFAWWQSLLGVRLLLIFICVEYLAASLFAWRMLEPRLAERQTPFLWRVLLRDYWRYCSPLIVYSGLGFAYTFADNWMLQRFGGSTQQAYFAVGAQFSTISMFATVSMLQIFWKEVAEAHAKGDLHGVEKLYRKVSRFLYAVAAVISGFLVPWSRELIQLTLGAAYVNGAPILALMLLYPLHQTMGQVNTTVFFATARTGPQVKIGIASMLASIPVSYLVLAPRDGSFAGLELGGIGMAIKLIVMTVIVVNLTSWWFSRAHGWRFEWAYQFQSLAGTAFAGIVSYLIGKEVGALFNAGMVAGLATALFVYLVLTTTLIWTFPEVAGLTRAELDLQAQKLRRLLTRKSA